MSSAKIDIAEQVVVAAEPAMVWDHVIDPHFIVTCIPGARVLDEHDGVIDGALEVRLGPTVVNFLGTAEPTYDHDARAGELLARGADKGGRTRAQSTLTFRVLANDGGHDSTVVFDGGIELVGGLAGFLQTGGAHLTRRMMMDFKEQLAARIEAAGAVAAPAEAPAADSPDAAAPAGVPAGPAAPTGPTAAPNAPVNGLQLLAAVLWDWLRSSFRHHDKRNSA
jgi:carbon-monoxide dehydrogenase small subunit